MYLFFKYYWAERGGMGISQDKCCIMTVMIVIDASVWLVVKQKGEYEKEQYMTVFHCMWEILQPQT